MTTGEVDLQFLAGGGSMGERIRALPWANTRLGPPELWPQGLRTAVRILLTTQHPLFIFWGTEHICLYNDGYSQSLGPEKHPAILGARGADAWQEIWPDIVSQIEYVMEGKGATWHRDQLLPIFRHGEMQDVYWTYSYSPIDDPESPHGIGGVLVICTETTEQVLAARTLSAERERFVQLFDSAPIFLAVLEGPEHVIKLANTGYLKLVGHRPIVGRRIADAIPEAVGQGYLALLDQVYRSGQSYSAFGAKFAIQPSPDGPTEDRYVDFIYQPMTGADGAVTGILVQGVDVTARANSERALALNRSRLDYATRLSGVGFWYCDLPFDVLEWDDRVKEHFFFAPTARITIDDFYSRIHDEDRERTRQAIAASVSSRAPYDIVYRTVHPATGAVKWIRALGGTDYASDGTPAFLAMLSHELRNPLAPIRAAARVIASPQLTPAQLHRAQVIIERQVTNMSLLLDDLLDIARITQGKLQLKKTTVSLFEVVDAAVEAVRPALESKSQPLSLSLPAEPLSLSADPLRLSQVLSNLLTNASKYSDPGSRIELAAAAEDDSLRLSVKDEGIGLAPESVAGIFAMFSQIEGVRGMSDGGLGIGLALVKGLTELHGGAVEARSAGLGQGSQFIVRIPLVPAPRTESLIPDPLASAEPVRRKVLVADDNQDAAEGVSMLIELAGHEVRVAHSGQAVLSLAQLFRPDIALLDIGMPDLSGYEVARRLRKEPWATSLHLIALTGWGQDRDRRQALEAGFDHHLSKPVDPDMLLEFIRRGHAADR